MVAPTGGPVLAAGLDCGRRRIHAAATPRGVCRISLRARSAKAFLEDLAGARRPGRPAGGRRAAAAWLRRLERELAAYLDGRRRGFTVPVDLEWLTAFQKAVLRATARIPYGGVATYAQVAAAAGRPRAARAAGNALGANPVPILIPCHRVVASGGRIGGFTGGVAAKRALLRIEGVRR